MMQEETTTEPTEPTESDRPEWLPEKFTTGEDMANSYKSLEQRLGSAPKDYDVSKADGWIQDDDDGFKQMLDLAREKSVPQEVMDKMLETTSRYADVGKIDYQAEREALGEDSKERLEVLGNWAKSNLSEDAYYALTGTVNTAQGIKALEEIRGMMLNDTTVIPTGGESQNSGESMEEIQSEMNNNLEKYKTDMKYRNDMRSRIEKANGLSFVDKTSA